MEDDNSHTARQEAECILRGLESPTALIFVAVLNACFLNSKMTQKDIANALHVVSASLTHWRNGARTMPVEAIVGLAACLDWGLEVEQLLLTAWRHDRDVKVWRDYVREMITSDNYRQLPFIKLELHELRSKLAEAKNRARSFPPPETAHIDYP